MAARPDDPDDAVPSQGAVPTPEALPENPEDVDPPTGGPEPTDDERWAAIVAQLTAPDEPAGEGPTRPVGPSSGPAVTYPVAPGVPEPRVVRPVDTGADVTPSRTSAFSGRDWDGTAQMDDAEAADDAEEHFVAPDPGPVLGGNPLLTMAWLAVAGMPLFLLVVAIAWTSAPRALVQAAGVVFVLGVAVLVWRMPHRRDATDDDPGAVV